MPIYEYECSKCRKVTEIIQKFSDSPIQECPECGGSVEKLISRSSFHLKGSGWYASDYKSGSNSEKVDPPKKESKPAAEAKPVKAEKGSTTSDKS